MGKLVQKSVRLPPELVAYIDAQPGRNFSQKLVDLLGRSSGVCAGMDTCGNLAGIRTALDGCVRDLERLQARLEELSGSLRPPR